MGADHVESLAVNQANDDGGHGDGEERLDL